MSSTEKKTLFELINFELQKMNLAEPYSQLGSFITNDDKAAGFIRYMLSDDSYQVPADGSDLYTIAKARARHSAITYLLGLVFKPFGGIFDSIPSVLNIEDDEQIANKLWMITALYHDKGYYSDYLKKAELNYRITFNRYLLTDTYENEELKCLNQFSAIYLQTMAYSYNEISAYDLYALRYHAGEFDKEPNKRHDDERRDHGILGGIQLFHDLSGKAIKAGEGVEELEQIKACALTIAQHNIYKSSKEEADRNYDGYIIDGETVNLHKLYANDDFRVGKDTPLLLFLSLIDTIECVKKFSRGETELKSMQTITVLKSIYVSISTDRITIDLSVLEKKLEEKGLQEDFHKYKDSLMKFGMWTTIMASKGSTNNEFVLSLRTEDAEMRVDENVA